MRSPEQVQPSKDALYPLRQYLRGIHLVHPEQHRAHLGRAPRGPRVAARLRRRLQVQQRRVARAAHLPRRARLLGVEAVRSSGAARRRQPSGMQQLRYLLCWHCSEQGVKGAQIHCGERVPAGFWRHGGCAPCASWRWFWLLGSGRGKGDEAVG